MARIFRRPRYFAGRKHSRSTVGDFISNPIPKPPTLSRIIPNRIAAKAEYRNIHPLFGTVLGRAISPQAEHADARTVAKGPNSFHIGCCPLIPAVIRASEE
jgi:hypothetical protein